ncbi:thiamine ABC transporter substrate-binding protein [Candidatus Riesia sp. GBBU]|nr:thiamine ABC transporter substrate-binding protein [Candidatus Riesia sp. GBBU]
MFFHTIYSIPTLTIYIYNSFLSELDSNLKIKSYFEKINKCKLKFVGLGQSRTILSKLIMEGKKSKADIIMGLDNNSIELAKNTNLFLKSDIEVKKLKLPFTWDNNTFIPYSYGYYSFIYNIDKLGKIPRNFNELLNSKSEWKIIYQDPRISSTGFGLLLWIQKIYGEKSNIAWKKISQKTVTITKGWGESYRLFSKGESDLLLSYTTSIGFDLINRNKKRYGVILFEDGHYIQIELIAMLKNSKNQELSKKFINFVISPYFQKFLTENHWMYPVISIKLPKVYTKIPSPLKHFQFNYDYIEKNREKWINSWRNSIIR